MSSGDSPLELVDLGAEGPVLYVKRDDLLHEHVSGNKWRKLVPQVGWLLRGNARGFASVGGVHSNHLAALAALGAEWGFRTLGLVRAWDGRHETPTLAFAKNCGMLLKAVSRSDLRDWREDKEPSTELLNGMRWLPEGGTTRLGLIGLKQMVREVEHNLGRAPDAYWVSVGSGGTLAGIARATSALVHAVPAVRDEGLPNRVAQLLGYVPDNVTWHDGALGGFASGEPIIWEAIERWRRRYSIPLDPIYTAKTALVMEAALKMRPSSEVHVLVHTGGLQGEPAWRARWGY